MVTIKILPKYFTKVEATKAASYHKNLSKLNNQKITIEIIEAYKIYSHSNWSQKHKLGNPKPNQFMVIIKYIAPTQPIKASKPKTKSVSKPNTKKDSKPFMELKTQFIYKKVYLTPSIPTIQPNTIIIPFPSKYYRV